MLRNTTAVCGSLAEIWRAASMPFNAGMATSITTTSGVCSLGQRHGVAPVGGIGDHLEAGLAFEQQAQALADHGVIVGQQNADRLHSGSFAPAAA